GPENIDQVDGLTHLEERAIRTLPKKRVRVWVDRDDAKTACLQSGGDGASGFVRIPRCTDHGDGSCALQDLVRRAAHEISKRDVRRGIPGSPRSAPPSPALRIAPQATGRGQSRWSRRRR